MPSDVDLQIAALRERVGATNDAELATILGLQRSAVSQWRKREAVPAKVESAVRTIEANRTVDKAMIDALGIIPDAELELCRALAIAFIARYTHQEPTRLLKWSRSLNEVILAAYRLMRMRASMKPEMSSGAIYDDLISHSRFFEHDMIESLSRSIKSEWIEPSSTDGN